MTPSNLLNARFRRRARPPVILFVALIGYLSAVDSSRAATPTRQEYTNAMVAKWTAIFGDVQFSEERLFACMHYVRPQPVDAFRPFTTEKMSERYSLELGVYLREFFKPAFQNALKSSKPSKYYLNEGRAEPSLLRYEFDLEGHRVVMVENFTVFLVVAKPEAFSADRPVGNQLVADLIFKWVNVRESSQAEVVQKFKLPAQLRVGDVFTNRSQPDPLLIESGRDHVVGYVSKEGICLIIYKAQEGRAAMGLHVDYNWVNRQIFEADGTTRMDHPKYFDKSANVENLPKP